MSFRDSSFDVSGSTQNQALSAGLRLEECLELRVKDLDFDRQQITVRQGKGRKDRVTMLPAAVQGALTSHLAEVRRLHEADLAGGFGRVVLPFAVDRKYPNAATEWRWQFVFPAGRICRNAKFGPPSRYHLHESVVRKAVAGAAGQAGLIKRISPHTMRHCFARKPCQSNDFRESAGTLPRWIRVETGAYPPVLGACRHGVGA